MMSSSNSNTNQTYTSEQIINTFNISELYIKLLKTLPNSTSDATLHATEQYISKMKQMYRTISTMNGIEHTASQLQQQQLKLELIRQHQHNTMQMFNITNINGSSDGMSD